MFQRQLTNQANSQIVAGDLIFGQILREDVGGIVGLDAPTSVVLGPTFTDPTTHNLEENVWVGSVGTSNDIGGLASFVIDLEALPPPSTQTTEYSAMKAVTLAVANGNDTITLNDPPPALVATTTIMTGSGQDQVVVNNYGGATTINLGNGPDTVDVRVTAQKNLPNTGPDSLVINGGTGEDSIDIASTGDDADTTFQGNPNAIAGDNIVVESVGDNAVTDIYGSDLADTVRIELANLPTDSTTLLEGGEPSTLPGDTLILDPQDPSANIIRTGDLETGGTAQLAGKGTVSYNTFETQEVLSSPVITFSSPTYTVDEGQSLTLTVTGTANGTSETIPGPLLFDIEGNGNFGDVTAIATVTPVTGAFTATVTIPWSRLLDFELNDVGSYRIAVEATNGDGLSATATADVDVVYAAPTVTLTTATGSTAATTTTVGTPFTVDFSALWPTPVEQPLEWIVNWGDGTALVPDIQIFGATTTSATHTYLTTGATGAMAIQATVVDKDKPSGTGSNILDVTVNAATPNPGGPYTINEGDSLTVSGSAAGDPTGYIWNIGTGVYNTQAVTLSWAQLEADGITTANGGNPYVMHFSAIYTDFSDSNTQTASVPVNLIVGPTAPTFTSVTNGGTVNQDQSATVTINGATDVSSTEAQNLQYRFFIPGTSFDVTQSSNMVTVPGKYLLQVGQQLVDVEVTDAEGLSVFGSTLITVNKVAPTLTASGPATDPNEGSAYALTLNETESDPLIAAGEVIESWDVNWGDGTTSHYTLNPAVSNSTIAPTHVYLENGTYMISATATDGDGDTYTANPDPLVATILNVAPALQGVAVTSPINENGFATLSGQIVDASILDALKLTVNWGDAGAGQAPDISTYMLAAGTENFSVSHQYLSPGATNPGDYTISTFVSQTKPGGADSQTDTVNLEVDDVAPVLAPITVTPVQTTEGGHVVTVSGSYSDVGTLDTHTVTINFGDGTVMSSTDPNTTIVIDSLNRTFTATHLYLDNPNLTTTPSSDYTDLGRCHRQLRAFQQPRDREGRSRQCRADLRRSVAERDDRQIAGQRANSLDHHHQRRGCGHDRRQLPRSGHPRHRDGEH